MCITALQEYFKYLHDKKMVMFMWSMLIITQHAFFNTFSACRVFISGLDDLCKVFHIPRAQEKKPCAEPPWQAQFPPGGPLRAGPSAMGHPPQ